MQVKRQQITGRQKTTEDKEGLKVTYQELVAAAGGSNIKFTYE